MSINVKLIPNVGYVLTKKIEECCFRCFKILNTPYFYCDEKEVVYCKECDDKEHSRNHCKSRQIQHIHYNIFDYGG